MATNRKPMKGRHQVQNKVNSSVLQDQKHYAETQRKIAWEAQQHSAAKSQKKVQVNLAEPAFSAKAKKAKAKERWKKALANVRSNVRLDRATVPLLGLTNTSYQLEKLDRQHRHGKELIKEFSIWKESNTRENFFDWLDHKEKTTGKYLPRISYRTTDEAHTEVQVNWKDGKLFNKTKLCDTTKFKGKKPGFAAFSMSADHLFLTEHRVESDVHASLQGGARVTAAGMVQVKKGKITGITNFSGHYQPGLKNLLYAVKHIPESCFASDAKIVYHEPRWTDFPNQLRESNYTPIRSIGAWLSRKHKTVTMTRQEFINFAEKELEKKENKFMYKRDKKDNRFENTLYESLLAKTIIENDQTWRPLVMRINRWIYDKIVQNKNNKKMIAVLIENLKKHTKMSINKKNVLAVAEQFLLREKNSAPSVMFHGDFFEYVHSKMKKEKSYSQLPSYKKLRPDNMFSASNRGVVATSNLQRKLVLWKHPLYKSNALGIMPDSETSQDLSNYFIGQAGDHQPSKRYHELKGERLSHRAAQRHREKATSKKTFREEVIERDISLVSGASGTTTKIITPLLDSMRLTPDEIKEYLMVRASAVAAHGHHSMYEVMVLARNLGFDIQYNHRFYHDQFVTKAFRDSKPYKDFLSSYSQTVDAQMPKQSANVARAHETYVRVQKSMEMKDEKKRKIDKKPDRHLPEDLQTQIKSFDRSKLKKQTVYYASLGRARFLPKTHGYVVIGTPGTKAKRGFAQIYQSRQMRMQVPYTVSDKIVSTVLKSKKFKSDTKVAIKQLKGKSFQFVELFLKELFTIKAANKGLNIKDKTVQEEIQIQIANTHDKELRELVNLNKEPTVVIPGQTSGPGAIRDQKAFELGSNALNLKEQNHIDAMAVREVFQQQLLYRRYMEEKLGIGESTDMEVKTKPSATFDKSNPFLTTYSPLPNSDDMFSANCNKTAASILQAAEELTASRQKRPARPIESASMWSIGSSQRMFLWNPLQQSLKATILQLIGTTLLNKSPLEKQALADNKRNILKIISSLPLDQQKKALTEALNPRTALGQIFYTKRTGNWFNPKVGRGYLKKAQEMLNNLNKSPKVQFVNKK